MASRTKAGRRLLFDIETDGLLDELTTIHCIWLKDIDTGEAFDFCQDPMHLDATGRDIALGVEALDRASLLIGHNILHFDIPAIRKLYPGALAAFDYFRGPKRYLDTILCSRIIWPEIKLDDFDKLCIFKVHEDGRKELVATRRGFPKQHIGKHALEAWGYRLGLLKGDYTGWCKANGIAEPWAVWRPEMHDYCRQDVEVTERLFRLIKRKDYSRQALTLEHRFAEIDRLRELEGFPFDAPKAEALKRRLLVEKAELHDKLQKAFPPWEVHSWFTPKVNNSKLGYVKGAPFKKTLTKVFNAGSRQHIEDRLKAKHGWKPKELTNTGQAKIDETVLASLRYPEAKLLATYLTLEKRLGQLAEGAQAWLNLVTPAGRIHGRMTTVGAVTRRVTHQRPNMSAVPKVGKPYGAECRELFHAPEGWVLVGCDASAIQPRCLGHYLAHWDGGEFAREILEADLYLATKGRAGGLITDRATAKTVILAILFGARAPKIAAIIKRKKAEGQQLLDTLFANIPALAKLRKHAMARFDKPGFLTTLDGGRLTLRADYRALNTLLQGAEAVLMKWAVCRFFEHTLKLGLVWGRDWALVGFFHDEVQFLARPRLAKRLGQLMADCIREAGEHFKLRIPLAGEFKIGRNWRETH